MAEYSMTYADVKSFVDECISKSENQDLLNQYKAEILAVLTMRNEDKAENDDTDLKDSQELWENQINYPSEILLGTRYISIKSSITEFVEAFFVSGMMEMMIKNCLTSTNLMQGIPVGSVAGVGMSLKKILTSTSKLDDYDFCVYMQAVVHSRKYKEFTLEDLLEWFPEKANLKCNIRDSRWECTHYENGNECTILQKDSLSTALESLEKKNILTSRLENGIKRYRFVF